MDDKIQEFQSSLGELFKNYILSISSYGLGINFLEMTPAASISISLSDGAESEPILAEELVLNSRRVRGGPAELFQHKSVALWADLLCDVYSFMVAAHIRGDRSYPSLGKPKVTFDFESGLSAVDQIASGLAKDFAFADYKSKYKVVARAIGLQPDDMQSIVILKHIELRNAFQHHHGRLHVEGLKSLGAKNVMLMDDNGRPYALEVGGEIYISSVEVDVLKSALFQLSSRIGDIFE